MWANQWLGGTANIGSGLQPAEPRSILAVRGTYESAFGEGEISSIVRLAAPVEGSAPAMRSLLYWNTVVALACAAAAVAGLVLAPPMEGVVAIWPAAGIALAALMIHGNGVAPGIFLANLLIHLFLKVPVPAALTISAAAMLGPAGAAWIVRWIKLDPALGSVGDALRYAAIACLQAVIAVPTIGVIVLPTPRSLPWEEVVDLWGRWAMADCISVLAVAPLLLWFFGPETAERRRVRTAEFAVTTAFLLIVTGICYSLSRPVGYPVLLVVMLIALRHSQREVGIAVLGVVTLVLGEIMYRDWLPLSGDRPSVIRVLDFLVVMSAGTLILGGLVAEARRKDAQLLRANQERLKQSETRFEDTFETSPQGMAIVALDGRWLRVNDALCRITGYSESELLASDFQSITHPEDLANDQAIMEKMLAGEISTTQLDKRCIHRSGKVIIVLLSVSLVRDAQGEPFNYVVQVMDITDRKRAEELWRFGLENAGDVVWDRDIPSGRVVFSGKVLELLGYTPDQVPSTSAAWRALVHPDDMAETKKKIKLLLEVPGYSYKCEYRVRCADGTYKWILSRGLVMSRDRDDKPIRAVGTIADVTEIRDLQEKLHQSDKMAALGQLTGGVAHDVNNDLGVILGSAEMILERTPAGSREETLSARILSSVQRSRDLVRRMLAFSRQAQIAPEPLELAGFLKSFVDTLGRTLGAGIQTRVSVADPDAVYWVHLDRSMLESCLINLSVNARDAMPDGGVLTLSLATEPGGTGGTDAVLLTVADSGSGMSEAVQRRIFEPFFTTKPAGSGTGLGLAMVYGFVQQSGGRIDVESRVGAGTRFLLRFAAGAKADPVRNDVQQPPPRPIERTVLLVDDNDVLRLTMREQLASLGCSVREAATYDEAVAILDSDVAMDFIFSDLDLGTGPDGMALAQWARKNGYQGPGAIISGHLTAGSDLPENWHSLQKPIELAVLRKLLAAASDREAPRASGQIAATAPSAILVVEDNADMRLIVLEALKRRGHRVVEAATGHEALHKLKGDTDIGLVLSDMGLPDMPGRRLIAEIQRLRPATSILLMTGSSSSEASNEDEPKAAPTLQKPFSTENLTRFVEEALARTSGPG
jgi:PAS domain S-box-containing protein